jgi:hypothetical protein
LEISAAATLIVHKLLRVFFAASNVIDTHNQLHQDNLKLEKKWLIQSPWFRLATTLIGVVVTNTFLLCTYHKVIKVINGGNGEQQEKKYHSVIFWYFGPSADPDGKKLQRRQ